MVTSAEFIGPSHAAVYCAGRGLRMEADSIKDEFGRNGPALRVLLRCGQALIAQIAMARRDASLSGFGAQATTWRRAIATCRPEAGGRIPS